MDLGPDPVHERDRSPSPLGPYQTQEAEYVKTMAIEEDVMEAEESQIIGRSTVKAQNGIREANANDVSSPSTLL